MVIRRGYQKAIHTGVIGAKAFAGAGTDDVTLSGNPLVAGTYQVYNLANEEWKWSDDNGATWESDPLPIQAGVTVGPLKTSDGIDTGLYVTFASAAGHVDTETSTYICTGQLIAATIAAIGTFNTTPGAEQLIIRGVYTKGTEGGAYLQVSWPRSTGDATMYQEAQIEDIGGGIMVHHNKIYRLDATGPFEFAIPTRGKPYFKVWNYKVSGTQTGAITCWSELYFDR